LLEAIECLDQATEVLGASRINITRRLSHVYLFLQNAMKESILNIHLTEIPTSSDSE
jgi:hypothetical protein